MWTCRPPVPTTDPVGRTPTPTCSPRCRRQPTGTGSGSPKAAIFPATPATPPSNWSMASRSTAASRASSSGASSVIPWPIPPSSAGMWTKTTPARTASPAPRPRLSGATPTTWSPPVPDCCRPPCWTASSSPPARPTVDCPPSSPAPDSTAYQPGSLWPIAASWAIRPRGAVARFIWKGSPGFRISSTAPSPETRPMKAAPSPWKPRSELSPTAGSPATWSMETVEGSPSSTPRSAPSTPAPFPATKATFRWGEDSRSSTPPLRPSTPSSGAMRAAPLPR